MAQLKIFIAQLNTYLVTNIKGNIASHGLINEIPTTTPIQKTTAIRV